MSNLRLAIIAVITLMMLLLASFFLFGHKANDVKLQMSPSIAAAKLTNGKTLTQGSFYLKPGNYTLTATFAGFASKTVTFTVTSSKVTSVVAILLPNSPAGYQWLAAHPDEQQAREQLGSSQFQQAAKTRQAANPILNILPHIELYFRIDYGKSVANPNDSQAVGIYVTLYNQLGKQQALDWLTKQGYDPSKLEIIYVDNIPNQATPDD